MNPDAIDALTNKPTITVKIAGEDGLVLILEGLGELATRQPCAVNHHSAPPFAHSEAKRQLNEVTDDKSANHQQDKKTIGWITAMVRGTPLTPNAVNTTNAGTIISTQAPARSAIVRLPEQSA